MTTFSIDVSGRYKGNTANTLRSLLIALGVLMLVYPIGIAAQFMEPVFGVSMNDLVMGTAVVGMLALFFIAIHSVHKAVKDDNKAHNSFLSQVEEVSGLKMVAPNALIVNNIAGRGMPRTLAMTDGKEQSVWRTMLEEDRLTFSKVN